MARLRHTVEPALGEGEDRDGTASELAGQVPFLDVDGEAGVHRTPVHELEEPCARLRVGNPGEDDQVQAVAGQLTLRRGDQPLPPRIAGFGGQRTDQSRALPTQRPPRPGRAVVQLLHRGLPRGAGLGTARAPTIGAPAEDMRDRRRRDAGQSGDIRLRGPLRRGLGRGFLRLTLDRVTHVTHRRSWLIEIPRPGWPRSATPAAMLRDARRHPCPTTIPVRPSADVPSSAPPRWRRPVSAPVPCRRAQVPGTRTPPRTSSASTSITTPRTRPS